MTFGVVSAGIVGLETIGIGEPFLMYSIQPLRRNCDLGENVGEVSSRVHWETLAVRQEHNWDRVLRLAAGSESVYPMLSIQDPKRPRGARLRESQLNLPHVCS